ncbi:MAG: hypothetical protein ABI132_12265 [Rhodanobacteraceae bacterium]
MSKFFNALLIGIGIVFLLAALLLIIPVGVNLPTLGRARCSCLSS